MFYYIFSFFKTMIIYNFYYELFLDFFFMTYIDMNVCSKLGVIICVFFFGGCLFRDIKYRE